MIRKLSEFYFIKLGRKSKMGRKGMEFNTSLFIYINFCIRKIHTYLDYLDITFLKERYIYILSYIIFKNIIFKKKTSIFKILLMETLRKIQGQYKYIKIISD